MKRIRYTKYRGDLASEIDLEDLLQSLSDYLLDSGYYDPYSRFQELDHDLDSLREALRRVLESGELLDQAMQEKLNEMAANGSLDELIEKLLDRLEQQNYISSSRPDAPTDPSQVNGRNGPAGNVRFEVTDKSLDFLGFKTLRDLLGSLG